MAHIIYSTVNYVQNALDAPKPPDPYNCRYSNDIPCARQVIVKQEKSHGSKKRNTDKDVCAQYTILHTFLLILRGKISLYKRYAALRCHFALFHYILHESHKICTYFVSELQWNKEPSCTFATTNRWQNVHRIWLHWICFFSFQFNLLTLLFLLWLMERIAFVFVSNKCNSARKYFIDSVYFHFRWYNEW